MEREDALGTGPGALKAFRFIQCPEPRYNEGNIITLNFG